MKHEQQDYPKGFTAIKVTRINTPPVIGKNGRPHQQKYDTYYMCKGCEHTRFRTKGAAKRHKCNGDVVEPVPVVPPVPVVQPVPVGPTLCMYPLSAEEGEKVRWALEGISHIGNS